MLSHKVYVFRETFFCININNNSNVQQQQEDEEEGFATKKLAKRMGGARPLAAVAKTVRARGMCKYSVTDIFLCLKEGN